MAILRTHHLPSLKSPTLNNLRPSTFSSLNFSSLKSPNLSPLSQFLSFLPKIFTPLSSHFPSTSFNWTPSMVGSSRSKGRVVAFSAGNVGTEEGREILVQHLLVTEDNLKLLLELQQRIAGGADLSDLAVEYSVCPSKENGGMLGWVRKGQMRNPETNEECELVELYKRTHHKPGKGWTHEDAQHIHVPEFEEAAFSASLNKVVRCKTKFGWHLLQVLSEREEALLQDIEPEELHVKMKDPSFLEEAQLIDVREPDEVSLASLPGFKVLPLRQFGSWGTEITNEFDPQKHTYVLCHHGVRSLQVAKWLQTQGFKKVFNISGGIHAYAMKADASIPTY